MPWRRPANGRKLSLSRARDCWRHCATTDCVKAALADGAVLAIVPPLFESGKPTKANVSLDARTLQAIDEGAAAHGLTRSAFIASAALEKIRRGT
jgi:HicB_like antitoxin of bacterial toxin-antitoxin system